MKGTSVGLLGLSTLFILKAISTANISFIVISTAVCAFVLYMLFHQHKTNRKFENNCIELDKHIRVTADIADRRYMKKFGESSQHINKLKLG